MIDRAALRKRATFARTKRARHAQSWARVYACDVSDLLDTLEAVEERCEDVGKPIGYDPMYALAQDILAILEGGKP